MKLILAYPTNVGTFYIGQSNDNRYHPIFNDEDLGSYADLWAAVEDLAFDATYSVLHPETNELLDTSELGIPEDYTEWKKL